MQCSFVRVIVPVELFCPPMTEVGLRPRVKTMLCTVSAAVGLAEPRVAVMATAVFEETVVVVMGKVAVVLPSTTVTEDATLAVAESCTGGLLAERITSISGSSRYFLGGAVVYSNQLKTAFADVPAQLIEKHGAVSSQVAAALAEGIRKRCGSTLGIGITGVAGPAGGTPEKPVGLVFLALASEKGTEVAERTFPGDRKRIRFFASQLALDMIRRKLM